MIKQFRLERFNGIEYLVCEFFERHTWTQAENEAFAAFSASAPYVGKTKQDFRIMLDEWLEKDHETAQSFFGLSEPIPVIDCVPHMVVRCAVVSNRIASVQADFLSTVTSLEVKWGIDSMFEFIRSSHWRNTLSNSVEKYGSLFGTDNDS